VLTYGQLLERASRLSNALSGAGLRAGDRVAAMLEDRLQSIEVYVACALGGFPIIHINDRLAPPEVEHIVTNANVRAFIHTDGRSEVVSQVPGLDNLAVFATIGSNRAPGSSDFETLLETGHRDLVLGVRGPDDLAIVGYTSGTTGFPKGAMVSQAALTACVKLLPTMYRISPYGRCAFTGTLSFVSGIWGVIYPHLYMGGTTTFLHPYTPESWVDHMANDRSTFTYAPSPLVPGFIEEIRRRPEALDSLESVLHSASPLPANQVRELVELIGERYVEVWGMTEGVAPFSATVRGDWRHESAAADVFASSGRAFPTARIRSVDPQGNELGPDQEGELVVDSEILFSGYLDDPQKTSEVMTPLGFATGDLGRIDSEGYVYVVGRKKELIITGGMNVYPAEIEAALSTLDNVLECSVFGLPDEQWGEAVAVAIVLRPGSRTNEEDVTTHLRSRVASYKKPTRVYFVDSLPRNASLKVLKAQLISRFAGSATYSSADRDNTVT
jgi:acyl-CoA synthetase (AMP-forming)/AMP-acid ligase II